MKYTQNLRIDGGKVYSYNTHVATIDGGKLLVHGHWSTTTSKHINYVAKEFGLTQRIDKLPNKALANSEPADSGMLKMVAGVAALAAIFTNGQKESNDWKARMMKAGLTGRGLMMPDNWDQLPENEKTRRLDKALTAIA